MKFRVPALLQLFSSLILRGGPVKWNTNYHSEPHRHGNVFPHISTQHHFWGSEEDVNSFVTFFSSLTIVTYRLLGKCFEELLHKSVQIEIFCRRELERWMSDSGRKCTRVDHENISPGVKEGFWSFEFGSKLLTQPFGWLAVSNW